MKYVRVSLERIKELINAEDQLYRLEGAGVDNWQGYDECWEDYTPEPTDEMVEEEFTILDDGDCCETDNK